jgi:hypothetical protein
MSKNRYDSRILTPMNLAARGPRTLKINISPYEEDDDEYATSATSGSARRSAESWASEANDRKAERDRQKAKAKADEEEWRREQIRQQHYARARAEERAASAERKRRAASAERKQRAASAERKRRAASAERKRRAAPPPPHSHRTHAPPPPPPHKKTPLEKKDDAIAYFKANYQQYFTEAGVDLDDINNVLKTKFDGAIRRPFVELRRQFNAGENKEEYYIFCNHRDELHGWTRSGPAGGRGTRKARSYKRKSRRNKHH